MSRGIQARLSGKGSGWNGRQVPNARDALEWRPSQKAERRPVRRFASFSTQGNGETPLRSRIPALLRTSAKAVQFHDHERGRGRAARYFALMPAAKKERVLPPQLSFNGKPYQWTARALPDDIRVPLFEAFTSG